MPAPVRQFLKAVEEHEDADSSSDGAFDFADGDNPISLLDAFGIYPSRAPSPGAPRKKRMAYSLLQLALAAAREAYRLDTSDKAEEIMDEDSVGSIFLPVWDQYQDICKVFWNARTSRTTRPTPEETQCAAPPTVFLPVDTTPDPPVLLAQAGTLRLPLEPAVNTKDMLPPQVPVLHTIVTKPSPRRNPKTSCAPRQRRQEQNGPLAPFRSSGWTRPRTPPLSAPPFFSPSPSICNTLLAAPRQSAGPSRSQWDDFATSSSGFSSARSRP
ncbi:hypothetical protein BD311DRAFT_679399 [Dichomitus squalens]|uniref:Uncharacterized protein n=1 Tax=Dichomitus squalens TaxID=114155 RepID=A0A4Q9M2Y4_9APHY|nr:hypothetical protein BD311DRAFT_679399 [Dichomitus squalens]